MLEIIGLDLYTLLVILHIIGVALGVGGASASDAIFFKSIIDGQITRSEYDFLVVVSRLIWLGLFILLTTGIGFLILATINTGAIVNTYNMDKILAKITLVSIITCNGFFLHLKILPLFRTHFDRTLNTPEFRKRAPLVFSRGAKSAVSWYTAMIIGAWRGYDFPLTTTLTVYGVILVCALIVANVIGFLLRRFFQKLT